MRGKELAKEWVEKAEEDFGFAASSLELEGYFAQICFHFQQAVEKYLKAFIVANGLEICKQKEPKIAEIEEACRYLNPFYIDTRYPVHWPTHYDKNTALKAKEAAEEVRKWIMAYFNF